MTLDPREEKWTLDRLNGSRVRGRDPFPQTLPEDSYIWETKLCPTQKKKKRTLLGVKETGRHEQRVEVVPGDMYGNGTENGGSRSFGSATSSENKTPKKPTIRTKKKIHCPDKGNSRNGGSLPCCQVGGNGVRKESKAEETQRRGDGLALSDGNGR
jgi:hypothetical protein